jgi:hypothetical protein
MFFSHIFPILGKTIIWLCTFFFCQHDLKASLLIAATCRGNRFCGCLKAPSHRHGAQVDLDILLDEVRGGTKNMI